MWYHNNESGGCSITIRVIPGAKKTGFSFSGEKDDIPKLKIRAKPIAGEANKAVIKYFSKLLHCAPSKISIVHGLKSREKNLHIEGITCKDFLQISGFRDT